MKLSTKMKMTNRGNLLMKCLSINWCMLPVPTVTVSVNSDGDETVESTIILLCETSSMTNFFTLL